MSTNNNNNNNNEENNNNNNQQDLDVKKDENQQDLDKPSKKDDDKALNFEALREKFDSHVKATENDRKLLKEYQQKEKEAQEAELKKKGEFEALISLKDKEIEERDVRLAESEKKIKMENVKIELISNEFNKDYLDFVIDKIDVTGNIKEQITQFKLKYPAFFNQQNTGNKKLSIKTDDEDNDFKKLVEEKKKMGVSI